MDPKIKDDYDWVDEYPNYHAWQTQDMENKGTIFELPINPHVQNGIIKIDGLHSNHRFLYEFMLKHQPKSILEVGCGYCNHLISINRLLPDIKIHGCDISYKQLVGGQHRYGAKLTQFNIRVGDFIDMSIEFKVDVVYSQAVLMHMSTDRAKLAIEKMCQIANKYVVSIDGGLIIPNIERFLNTLGKVTMMNDFAEKHWDTYVIPPFIIEI